MSQRLVVTCDGCGKSSEGSVHREGRFTSAELPTTAPGWYVIKISGRERDFCALKCASDFETRKAAHARHEAEYGR